MSFLSNFSPKVVIVSLRPSTVLKLTNILGILFSVNCFSKSEPNVSTETTQVGFRDFIISKSGFIGLPTFVASFVFSGNSYEVVGTPLTSTPNLSNISVTATDVATTTSCSLLFVTSCSLLSLLEHPTIKVNVATESNATIFFFKLIFIFPSL